MSGIMITKPLVPGTKSHRKSFFTLFTILFFLFMLPSTPAQSKDGWGIFKKKTLSPAITTVSAQSEHNYVNVKWVTRNQCIDGTYLIERSTDGETFEIIGLRRGVPSGPNNEMEFFFIDNEPPAGQVYYRIRHFGNDNSEILSKAVTGQ